MFLAGLIAVTGCSSARPKWVSGVAGEGHQYRYILGQAAEESRVDARRAASLAAFSEAVRSGQLLVQGSERITTVGRNSDGVGTLEVLIEESIQVEGAPRSIRGWELFDSFEEALPGLRGYNAWVLYRFERGTDARLPPSQLWWVAKSALLPGWGQRARGAKTRGNIFMGSFLGGATSWVLLGELRNREIDRLNLATTAPEQSDALNKANLYGDLRDGILATLAAIWTLSVVDAISGDSLLLPFRVHGMGTEGGVRFSVRVPF